MSYSLYLRRAAERELGGATGAFYRGPHSGYGPQKLIYSNRTVKYSNKTVTRYISPQALLAALYLRSDVYMVVFNFRR